MTTEAPFDIPLSSVDKGKMILRRLGRALFWSKPYYYRWLGRLRNRGDCLACDYDVWIDGFPRSANTFASELFRMANPGVRVSSHRHIPTFILSALKANKPGIMLLRKPADAAISWAIFWNIDVEPCLDYYLDFHRVLKPCAPDLFAASFEDVTTAFPKAIQAFNKHYGLSYNSKVDNAEMITNSVSKMEALAREADGSINEARVCRPSSQREAVKAAMNQRLQQSPRLRRKLEAATELYSFFRGTATLAERIVILESPIANPGVSVSAGLSR